MDSRAFSTVKNYLEYWQGRERGRIIKHLVEVLGNLSQQQKSSHAFLDVTSFSVELLSWFTCCLGRQCAQVNSK
jgi:hypothetical protein